MYPSFIERTNYQDKINSLQQRNIYSGIIDMSNSIYNIETKHVENGIQDVFQYVSELLHTFVECFELRKSSYVTQLRRMRDISNNATRNAIQTCKLDATTALNALKHQLDVEKEKEFHELKNRLIEAESSNGKIILQFNDLKAQISAHQLREQEYLQQLSHLSDKHRKYVEELTMQQQAKLQEEIVNHNNQLQKESQRCKREIEDKCNILQDQHQVSSTVDICSEP